MHTNRIATLSLIAAALLLPAIQAEAQNAPNAFPETHPRSLLAADPPKWDLGGGIGLFALTTAETSESWQGWQQRAEFRADVGRHWTAHLKTELSAAVTNQSRGFESSFIPVPSQGAPVYSYTEVTRRLYSVAPGLAWQFRENTFMHPYVSGGVKAVILREDLLQHLPTDPRGAVGGTAGPLESRTSVLVRPFVAGGFKSYFTRTAFVRTEGRLAFAEDGVRQFSLHVGLGLDF